VDVAGAVRVTEGAHLDKITVARRSEMVRERKAFQEKLEANLGTENRGVWCRRQRNPASELSSSSNIVVDNNPPPGLLS
jgi:hypothetical protein